MAEESVKKQVIQNSIWNLLAVLINRIGAVVFGILLARFLMPESFGLYNLALSVALILMTFADLGTSSALTRYVAEALGKNSKAKATAFFKYLSKVKLILSGVISALLLLMAYPLSEYLFKKPELFIPLLLSAAYIFIYSFEGFFGGLFYSFKKVKYIGIKEFASQTLRIIFFILILLIVSRAYYVAGTIIGITLTSLVSVLILIYYLKKFAPFLFQKTTQKIDKKRVLRFLLYVSIASITTTLFAYIDTVMIGILIPDASYVGYYRAAFSLVFSIAALFTFISVLFPVFTQTKKKDLERIFNKVFRYSAMITIPASFGLLVLGKYIMRLVYGVDYLPGALPLYFSAFLVFEMTSTQLLTFLFSAREKPELSIKPMIIFTILNIILNYLLVTAFLQISLIWAMTGAAIATLFTRVTYMFVLMRISNKRINVKVKLSSVIKPVIASLVFVIAIIYFNSILKDMTLLTGILEVLFAVLAYMMVMFLIKGISKNDFLELKNIF